MRRHMIEHIFPVMLVTAIAFLAGMVLGLLVRKASPKPLRDPVPEGEALLEQRLRQVSQELARTQEELDRKRTITFQIPIIVRRLSSRLAPSDIPALAVRITKDFFQASLAGYFAPVSGSDGFAMVEGVGFPPDWKNEAHLPSNKGMLGLALENRVVVTKEEYLSLRGARTDSPSFLEKAGITLDVVIPVVSGSNILGVILIGGCKVRLDEERQYASIIGDLISIAYQTSFSIASVERDAAIDTLTRIYNRKYFSLWFENELRRAKNYSQPLSITILDIDYFKKVNDAYGHAAGDMVLKTIAQIIKKNTRSSDLAARYGGEEFVVVTTSSNKDQAFTFAEHLRGMIASTELRVPGQEAPLKVTITCGVATFPEDGETTSDLIRAADEALYEGKESGRNRVVRSRLVGLDGKPAGS